MMDDSSGRLRPLDGFGVFEATKWHAALGVGAGIRALPLARVLIAGTG